MTTANPAPVTAGAPPRKKRRVFLWVFLAIQVLFLAWIITGAATANNAPSPAALASVCYHHNWYPLYKSQADCVTSYGSDLTAAGETGTAIGIGIVVALWVAVDIILGISYGVYRLARRPSRG